MYLLSKNDPMRPALTSTIEIRFRPREVRLAYNGWIPLHYRPGYTYILSPAFIRCWTRHHYGTVNVHRNATIS